MSSPRSRWHNHLYLTLPVHRLLYVLPCGRDNPLERGGSTKNAQKLACDRAYCSAGYFRERRSFRGRPWRRSVSCHRICNPEMPGGRVRCDRLAARHACFHTARRQSGGASSLARACELTSRSLIDIWTKLGARDARHAFDNGDTLDWNAGPLADSAVCDRALFGEHRQAPAFSVDPRFELFHAPLLAWLTADCK